MRIYDTHFHFTGDAAPAEYLSRVEVDAARALRALELAPEEPPELWLTSVGGDYLESVRAREFASVTPRCRFAAGVHPHEAAEYLVSRPDFSCFRDDPLLVAVGELGLDYYYEMSDRVSQRAVFSEFLDLAREWDRPAVVHLRDRDGADDAYRDALELLTPFSRAGGRFVVHCYAGSREYLERFLELGAYVGVTGMATFRAADNIRANLALVPAERLLIETDSPYLAPVPFRGNENTPGLLILAAAAAARGRGATLEELAELTWRNAMDFYRIGEGAK